MDGKSLDITAERIAQLKAMLPDVFSEDKIDLQRLKQALGEDTFVQGEHYELSWAGKTEARKEIQKQTTATLIPSTDAINRVSTNNNFCPHIFIEGENLEVLRTLQRAYFGKVKMIYIDPPYNTGSDSFVYPDDYTERQDEYKKRTGISDSEGFLNKQDLWRKNVKENGQFHSVWLSMMYPRLYLARNLLREDGVIFISIDDNEAANLKLLCDEIFGGDNFVANVAVIVKTEGRRYGIFAKTHENILIYSKNYALFEETANEIEVEGKEFSYQDEFGGYNLQELRNQNTRAFNSLNRPNLRYPFYVDLSSANKDGFCNVSVEKKVSFEEVYPLVVNGLKSVWRWGKQKSKENEKHDLIARKGTDGVIRIYQKYRKLTESPKTVWFDKKYISNKGTKEIQELIGTGVFDFPKPVELIANCLRIATGPSDLILDFFAGSGTTAQAVLELNEEDGGNRRFICVQMPEKTEEGSEAHKAGYKTIADITQARIRKVIEKIEKERQAKAAKANGELFGANVETRFIASLPAGYRSFKLAASNFKQWNKYVQSEEEILQQLELFVQSQHEDSLPENMLCELMLKSGFELTTPVERISVGEEARPIASLYNVANNRLWVFFDKYSQAVKKRILEAKPERLIFLDSCFDGDDVAITNLQLELREHGIDLTII